MCQYACLPAPKTVRSCTECLFLRSIVDASAVRKAVTSSALIKPVDVLALCLEINISADTCGVSKVIQKSK